MGNHSHKVMLQIRTIHSLSFDEMLISNECGFVRTRMSCREVVSCVGSSRMSPIREGFKARRAAAASGAKNAH